MTDLQFRCKVRYLAAPDADLRGAEQNDRLPSKRENRRTLHEAASPAVSPPASLLTRRQRDLDRFYGAVDNLWNRDHGAHRRELRALVALVDAGETSLAEATATVAELDAQTSRAAA